MVESVLSMGLAGEQTVRSYPLYDGHGSMVGQVARAEDDAPGSSFVAVPGAAAFEVGARRKYDAWGQVRWSVGSPAEQGYCANLQHRRDAESGLVYMRARYYEPWTGRFVSEDPAMDGVNWYVYCANDPVNRIDSSGKTSEWASAWKALATRVGIGSLLLMLIEAFVPENNPTLKAMKTAISAAFAASTCLAVVSILGASADLRVAAAAPAFALLGAALLCHGMMQVVYGAMLLFMDNPELEDLAGETFLEFWGVGR